MVTSDNDSAPWVDQKQGLRNTNTSPPERIITMPMEVDLREMQNVWPTSAALDREVDVEVEKHEGVINEPRSEKGPCHQGQTRSCKGRLKKVEE